MGQNFIINESLTDKIVSKIQLCNKIVIEIGPGPACLTRSILKQKPKKLILVEMDERFSPVYKELSEFYGIDIDIINKDCLDVDYKVFGEEISIVSNLPYNISTQIYTKLITQYQNVKEMVLMFQKEVADRIITNSGDKNFARLAVLTNLVGSAKKLFLVKPSAFLPPPKVMSMVIKYEVGDNDFSNINLQEFQEFTKALFSQKRKVVTNALKSININLNDIDALILNKRPHQLSMTEIKELYLLSKRN